MKNLDKIRDELADKFVSSQAANRGFAYCCFREGFDACSAHYEQMMRELVEALKRVERGMDDSEYGGYFDSEYINSVLTKWQKWSGE